VARRFQIDAPAEVQAKADEYVQIGTQFQRQGQSEYAFEAYRRAWEVMLTKQPDGFRFHKGRELANMGGARLDAGLLREGLRWMLYAFIEDCLSRSEDSPTIHDELQWPASQYLRRFGFGEADLQGLTERIRGVAAERLLQDPGTLFVEMGFDRIVARAPDRTTAAPTDGLTVFVSSPSELKPERRLVAEVCRELATVTGRPIRALLWEGAGPRNPECLPFPPVVTGLGGQAVIDDRIRDALGGYDIYLGMVWRRMGTPTAAWRSGTEAEFRYALEGYQREGRPGQPLFYTKAIRGSSVREPEVDAFISELRALGLTQTFRSTTELRRMLVGHLGEALRSS